MVLHPSTVQADAQAVVQAVVVQADAQAVAHAVVQADAHPCRKVAVMH
jgi:hypothetical protein